MYQLQRQDSSPVQVAGQTAWSVALTVTSSNDEQYPPKVFVFQVEDPDAAEPRAWFTAVATPAQLLEYPEDEPAAPTEGLWQPYFRTSELTLVSRNPEDLEETYQKVLGELGALRRNIDALGQLQTGTTETV